jgi:hypothetical protein
MANCMLQSVSIIIFKEELEFCQEFEKSCLGLEKTNAFLIESLSMCVFQELCLVKCFQGLWVIVQIKSKWNVKKSQVISLGGMVLLGVSWSIMTYYES